MLHDAGKRKQKLNEKMVSEKLLLPLEETEQFTVSPETQPRHTTRLVQTEVPETLTLAKSMFHTHLILANVTT